MQKEGLLQGRWIGAGGIEAKRHIEEPETPFDGRLTLHLTPEMHMELSKKAEAGGTTNLDAWVIQTLKERVMQHA